MNEHNKILAKLLEQFGESVYIILSYEIFNTPNGCPSAIIEHPNGTPTSIYYDKEKGEWR